MVVVQVRRVVVAVGGSVMVVSMRVLADNGRIVRVVVVPVVVAMGVLVVGGNVGVLVAVLLRDMQIDAGREADRRSDGPRARDPITECKRDGGAHERSQGEHRAGTCGADPALGE